MTADVAAAAGADDETDVESGTRDAGPAAGGTPAMAAGDVAVDGGGIPAVAINAGSGFGGESVAFVGPGLREAVSGSGRTETAALDFGRIGAAAVRTGDERADVEGRRLFVTRVEATVDGGADVCFGVTGVGCGFTGDATMGRSPREDVVSLRSTVGCAGATSCATVATSMGAVAALWAMEANAGF